MTETTSTEVVRVDSLNAVQVFTGGGMNAILEQIEATVRAIPLDVSTAQGRDEIRSVAYRVARSKTALDAEGKRLTEEWRKNTALVNAERKKATERLDVLADEIRKPLTDFENKDRSRVAAHEAALADMAGLLVMVGRHPDMSAKDLETHLIEYADLHRGRDWEEFADRAKRLRHATSVDMIAKIEARKKFEADQAELARLRQLEVERVQRERDDRLKAEAAEKARLAAERIAHEAAAKERARVVAEEEKVRLEHERIQREAEEDRRKAEKFAEEQIRAQEQARITAERRAKEAEEATLAAERKAEADRIAAEKKATAEKARATETLRLAKEKAKRDADAAAQAERDKIEAERKAAEAGRLKREADEANARRVLAEIADDIEKCGPSYLNISQAIIAGKIRNVVVVW